MSQERREVEMESGGIWIWVAPLSQHGLGER